MKFLMHGIFLIFCMKFSCLKLEPGYLAGNHLNQSFLYIFETKLSNVLVAKATRFFHGIFKFSLSCSHIGLKDNPTSEVSFVQLGFELFQIFHGVQRGQLCSLSHMMTLKLPLSPRLCFSRSHKSNKYDKTSNMVSSYPQLLPRQTSSSGYSLNPRPN